jgi:hypothetical protein
MAKQKPKYPQSELKNIGMGYDKIGFKNSSIDMIKEKMGSHMAELGDIMPSKFAPSAPEKAGRDVWTQDYPGSGRSEGFFEPNKRNAIIGEVYNATGKLTGKTGYSISAAKKYSTDLSKMKSDLSYGTKERFKKK